MDRGALQGHLDVFMPVIRPNSLITWKGSMIKRPIFLEGDKSNLNQVGGTKYSKKIILTWFPFSFLVGGISIYFT